MSKKHSSVWPIYKRLLGYTGAYWVFMVAAVIAMVVEALGPKVLELLAEVPPES